MLVYPAGSKLRTSTQPTEASDRTFSISEAQVNRIIQDILRDIQKQPLQTIKDNVLESLGQSVTGIISRAVDKLIPSEIFAEPMYAAFDYARNGGGSGVVWDILELIAIDALCRVFGDFIQNLYFGVQLERDGTPIDNGASCGSDLWETPFNNFNNSADYVFRGNAPKPSHGSTDKNGWLIGDFKLDVDDMYDRYIKRSDRSGQWESINTYAKRYQWIPMTLYIAWGAGKNSESQQRELIGEAASRGVIMAITALRS